MPSTDSIPVGNRAATHVRGESSYSCSSHRSSAHPEEWSIGSPALSITSIDPGSPSLQLKDRPNGSRSGNAPSSIRADDSEQREEQAADLRRKASNYLQYVESLSQAYENQLKNLSAFFKNTELYRSSNDQERYSDESLVTIIEVSRDGSRSMIGINDEAMLVDYFCELQMGDSEEPNAHVLESQVVSRVFLLDKMTTTIMGVFGAVLGVEPQFWDAHLQLRIAPTDGSAVGSGGHLVKYGSESGSKISFLNIPLLRRISSSESLNGTRDDMKERYDMQQEFCEGCSIHLDYGPSSTEPSTVLIITNTPSEISQYYPRSLRTSFIEQLMSHEQTGDTSPSNSESVSPSALTVDLIKGTVQHLTSVLSTIPNHTNRRVSHFTTNLFSDDTEKIRDSISQETTMVASLSRSLQNSLIAFDQTPQTGCDDAGSENEAMASGIDELTDAIKPLVCAFHDQSEQIQQWLKELDTAAVDHQRKRAAQLRRLKIVVPVCSISMAVGVAFIVAAKFRDNY
ncbi:hypothetical protein H072_8738 [Dactylellina haptotyla CBS 200.50]|uniref:Uncharacterized protein n=1 Tax=Dactylellina haptotyla (strain CBS 200.50) TaxID=1284197 RepID=S8A450_DACHA|nr:hypothetical protein H072_8738 [Dactylellina haptotyla CBS 200.50]